MLARLRHPPKRDSIEAHLTIVFSALDGRSSPQALEAITLSSPGPYQVPGLAQRVPRRRDTQELSLLDELYETNRSSHQLVNQAILVLGRNGPAEGRPLVDSINRFITALGGTLKLIADFGDEQLKIA